MSLDHNLQTKLALKARNDSEALAELIINYSGYVWAVIHERMYNRYQEDKEDVYQDVMFHLCSSIGSFKGKSSFSTWLVRIVINKIADCYRRDSRSRVFLMDDPDNLPDEIAIEPEWYNVYDEYKELLPKRHHYHFDVIYGIAVNGYTLSETAKEYHKSYEAIRSRQRDGKVYLKEDLEKQGITY